VFVRLDHIAGGIVTCIAMRNCSPLIIILSLPCGGQKMQNAPHMKTNILSLLFVLSLSYFSLSHTARAVVPPPDGGYPGFNTAEGQNALKNLSTGVANAAVGWYSLFSDTDGSYNTAVGAGTLLLNVGDQNAGTGIENTATGAVALLSNNTGTGNTADGAFALSNNDITGAGLGNTNTAVGATALLNNTDGDSNNAVGFNALGANVDGLFNNAMGFKAMADNVSGAGNVAVGDSAGAGVEGDFNIYIGAFAGPAPSPAPVAESETIRIGDEFNVACFIGGILSNPVPPNIGNTIVTIDPVTGQLGATSDAAAGKVAEQQKKIEEQQASINQLKSEMQTMVAQLREQAAQIQKVSAQLELSKSAPRTVLNNQ
jgi:hypothetical protein